MRRAGLLILLAGAACAHATTAAPSRSAAPVPAASPISVTCWSCESVPMTDDVARAIERRVSSLRELGGGCRAYADVIDSSYRSGRITIRPAMWRVGSRLAAGEARPTGEMAVALEIDSLNAGIRPIDEVLGSLEHEAVHIAFEIPSTSPENELRVDAQVRKCRS